MVSSEKETSFLCVRMRNEKEGGEGIEIEGERGEIGGQSKGKQEEQGE